MQDMLPLVCMQDMLPLVCMQDMLPLVCMHDMPLVCMHDMPLVCMHDMPLVCMQDMLPLVCMQDMLPLVCMQDMPLVCMQDMLPLVCMQDMPLVCMQDMPLVCMQDMLPLVCMQDMPLVCMQDMPLVFIVMFLILLIRYSNGVASPERFVRTRLYFTSESHIHSLLNMLRYGDFLDEEKDEQWKRSMDFIGACAELNYMSQIVLMMFEDPAKDEKSDDRFHIELHFSPGAYTSCDEMASEPKGMGFRPKPNREVFSESTTPVIIPEEVLEPLSHETLEVPATLRQCSSVPDNVKQEELGDLVEADLFAHELITRKESQSDTIVCNKQKPKFKFHPHSPDPNTPEWDWGEDDDSGAEERENSRSREVTKHKKHQHSKEEVHKQKSLPPNVTDCCSQSNIKSPNEEKRSFSLPRSVELMLRKQDSKFDKESSDILEEEKDSLSKLAFKKTDPIQINVSITGECKSGNEEKRSRSLEDSSDIVTKLRDQDIDAAYQRNYRTIHLPLGSDVVVKPLSHFFFYNQAPRGGPPPLGGLSLIGSASSPDFSRLRVGLHGEMALEGFNNVPLLHPLETLHNNLTFHQMDDFLGRVTTNKFTVPDVTIALAKSVLNLCSPGRVIELPSSSNSSGGPNSPTVQTTPVDLFKTLGMYMGTRSISQSESESGADGKVEDPKDSNCSQNEDVSLEISSNLLGSYCITMNNTDEKLQIQNSFEELFVDDSVVK
ncbi:hypothetical protein Btru_019268 [Bulinus truncatus]|nr:hypothetical protein Btru_019268 [Bulinus truncatus]